MAVMPSCYSCRKVFAPSALRVSYSQNYCEGCGTGLFGADYFGFTEKPDPPLLKTIAVYSKVIFVGITGVCLLVFLFFSLSAHSNPLDSAGGNARVKEPSMLADLTGLQWKNRVLIVDNIQNDDHVLALFAKNASGMDDRNIVWFFFKEDRAFTNYPGERSEGLLSHARERYGFGQGQVVLIGKDGRIKSSLGSVDLQALFLKIDAMPMRQNEKRN